MKKVMKVVVENWARERLVENRGNVVAMEIARISCSHCSICSQRMDTVASRVHRAGLKVEWERREGGYLIVVPLPTGKDPVRHLNEVLALGISPVAIPKK